MSIKRTLVGNLIGFTRAGQVFTTITVPNDGIYLNFGISDGKGPSGVIQARGAWLNADNLKPKKLPHTENQLLDIISLYRPIHPMHLFEIHTDVDLQEKYSVVHDAMWTEEIVKDVESANPVQAIENDPSKTINVKTEVWIEINGKKVDPNNMTEDEHKILVGLGILN